MQSPSNLTLPIFKQLTTLRLSWDFVEYIAERFEASTSRTLPVALAWKLWGDLARTQDQ
jgi:hypothetical protein